MLASHNACKGWNFEPRKSNFRSSTRSIGLHSPPLDQISNPRLLSAASTIEIQIAD
jgi:hypothetical protein